MVKPDGVHQRLTGAVLAFLARHGFTALAMRDLLLTPDLRARLYATTRTTGRLDWDLNAVLYTLGPVTAVLLRGPPGAAALLSGQLKGHFLPTRARRGTLRGDLNAMNPIFNLVHASDDETELAREVPVLFGCPVDDLLREGDVATSEPARPLDHWRSVSDVLTAFLGSAGSLPVIGPDQRAAFLGGTGSAPVTTPDRRAAFAAVRRARPVLLAAAERSRPSRAAGLPALLAGSEVDLPDLTRFSAVAQSLPDPPSSWGTYLAYTSLRYLDLCLEPGAGT
jgi:nucleoside diphosphate kinase